MVLAIYVILTGSEGVSAAAEFDVTLEKLYKWRADSVTEKDDLIQVLWKVRDIML